MASSNEYKEFVLEQLSLLDNIKMQINDGRIFIIL